VTALLLLVVGSVVPSGCASRPAAAERPAVARSDAALEAGVLALVNRHRAARGLRALHTDPRIARQARAHSVAMANGVVPAGHDGFDARADAIRRALACRALAENVAENRGYDDAAAAAVEGWLRSRAHRSNIEGPYESTGVGAARDRTGNAYVTQIFAGGCGTGAHAP
jgi:uncharacterized protein YkwD